jgi:ethanolamine utilization protein EutQ
MRIAWLLALLAPISAAASELQPILIPHAKALSTVFDNPATENREADGGATANRPLLRSSDGKMVAGIYQSGPSHFTFKSYPVDEFMYFLDGGVTLTSADGVVIRAAAGDAVSIPKGWIGVWDSPAYRKYYVEYLPEAAKKP